MLFLSEQNGVSSLIIEKMGYKKIFARTCIG